MDKSLNKYAFAFYIGGLCPSLVLIISILSPLGKTVAHGANTAQAVGNNKQSALGLLTSNPDAARVWNDFSKRNNYRLARAEDFVLSADRYRAYGDGDFNGDQIYDDFAVIIVDNARTDASRFGLVIFNARNDLKRYDGPFWLYRGVDLSRTTLNLISHGPLVVSQSRGEKETSVCVVKWVHSRRNYRCERAPLSLKTQFLRQ